MVVGVRVLRGEESEATALWPLVDTFLASVGPGVMKVLLLDRGFINGAQIGRLKQEHGIDTVIPIKSSWWDCPVPLTGVYSRAVYADGHEDGWLLVTTNADASARRVRGYYALRTDIEERHRQVKCFWDLARFHSTAWSLVVSQTVFVCLTYSLLQIHLLQKGHQDLNRRTWPTSRRLLPDGDRVIIYRQQCFAFFTLLEHMEMTLSLEGKARRRALSKARRLLHDAAAATAEPAASAAPPPAPSPYV